MQITAHLSPSELGALARIYVSEANGLGYDERDAQLRDTAVEKILFHASAAGFQDADAREVIRIARARFSRAVNRRGRLPKAKRTVR